MYRNREDINKLVNSLSSAEKRYLTGIYGKPEAGKERPLFLLLFDLQENGESQLPESFYNASPKAVTSAKRRLYANILKALRGLHDGISVNTLIQNYLNEIEILYNRSLPEQGMVILNKAYALATKNEKYGLLLQVLDWEKRLNVVVNHPTRPIESIMAEEREVNRKLTQIMALESIHNHILGIKRQYGFAKGEIREMLESETIHSPDMPALEDCLTNKAIYYYNYIHSLYQWMVFNHRESYGFSSKLLAQNSNSILPNDFIGGILQHITSCVCLGHFKDTLNGITLAEAYIREHSLDHAIPLTSLMFVYHATYKLIVYNYMGNTAKLSEAVRETEVGLKRFNDALTLEKKQIVTGNLMNGYMGLGMLDKAYEIWDAIFNKEAKTVRRDIYSDLYIFRLYYLLQTKSYGLLPSASLSAVRYFQKFPDCDEVFEVELPIAKLLQKERDYTDKETLRAVMEEVSAHVQKFISGLKDRNNFQEHYSRYTIWCDAIVNDEPYHMAAKRWYEGYGSEHAMQPHEGRLATLPPPRIQHQKTPKE